MPEELEGQVLFGRLENDHQVHKCREPRKEGETYK